jgi:PAS domain S-box-containing protein
MCHDTEHDARVDLAATRKVQARSMVVAPLRYTGRVVGVLKIMAPAPHAFDDRQVATLELMAGLLGGALGHAQEFAERTRAEAEAREAASRFSSVLRAATEVAIIGVDLHRALIVFNDGAERMLGYTRDEVLGQLPARFFDTAEIMSRAAARGVNPADPFLAGAQRGEATTDEWTMVRKDGSRLTASLTTTPMHGEDGGLVGFIGIATDVTERRAVERMKDEFVSVVSHELRTPLTSIRGALGLLAGGVLGALPERGQRMLDIAVDNTDRLLRLINDILDLERIQSGRIEMERGDADLAELMCRAADVMRSMAEHARVQLEVRPLRMRICADSDRVMQVLTNLLSNAIKFSPRDTAVCLRAAQLDTDHVRIEVQDRGRGIPADQLERIFGRFQQVDASDSRVKGGTGLGLAICRSIVDQHGGRIWAESTVGQGTTMVVELPIRAPQSVA